jgi:DNA-binding CsgD family transcriptional regulator
VRLSHRDFDAFLKAVLELHQFRESDAFRAAVPQILLKIIPAEVLAWPQWDVDGTGKPSALERCVASDSVFPSRMLQVAPLLPHHPFNGYFAKHGGRTALKISDFATLRQFRDTIVYQDGHRILGTNRELATPVLPTGGLGWAAVGLGRQGMDFTERDRLVLNLLRPHFEQADRNADLCTARRAARAKPLASYNLTPRESEVALWLAQGKTNPEIAIILQLSARTVEKHVERILEKIGVENRAAAAVMVAQAAAVRD